MADDSMDGTAAGTRIMTTLMDMGTSILNNCTGTTCGEEVSTAVPTVMTPESHRTPCPAQYADYCLNGGVCQQISLAGRYEQFCVCAGPFGGPRCQYFDATKLDPSTEHHAIPSSHIYIGVIAALSVVVLIMVALYYYRWQRKENRRILQIDASHIEQGGIPGPHSGSNENLIKPCIQQGETAPLQKTSSTSSYTLVTNLEEVHSTGTT